jgi:hypothetical protein
VKYFSEDEDYINAECDLCNKVVKILKTNCTLTEEGYELNSPRSCVCGQTIDSIRGHAREQSTERNSYSPQSAKNFSQVEKKATVVIWISLVSGGLIGLAIAGFWGLIIGGFVCTFIGMGLFELFASETTRKDIAEYRQHKQAQRHQRNARPYLSNIKCPTCQSRSVKKITVGKKIPYVAGFGIIAPAFKKVRSQFECSQCGYKW